MAGFGINADDRAGVHLTVLDQPLTPDCRAGLMALLDGVADRAGLVIVLTGSGPMPVEPDHAAPTLRALCAAVEAAPVPVVVALAGAIAGSEAELALAATARVATATARLAFTDIALGLLSAAGATQRLPRLVGPDQALRLLTTAQAVAAGDAQAMGLVDVLAEGNPADAALALATELAAGRRLPRATHDPTAWLQTVAAARQRVLRGGPDAHSAVARIIDCVEAALVLPPENGFALEQVAREDLEDTDEVRALCAAALAERRAAALPPAVARQVPTQLREIGLCGEDPALVVLAATALLRGLAVVCVTPDAAAMPRARAAIEARLDAGQRARLGARLRMEGSVAALSTAGLVIHGRPPDATARLSLSDTVHLALGGAPGMLGLALSPSGRVCELTLPMGAGPDEGAPAEMGREVATAVATLRRLGVRPVLVGRRPGLGQAVTGAGTQALRRMAASGVPRRMILVALEDLGVRMPEPVWPDPPAQLRAMTLAEIGDRWLAALANAGLQALDEGVARRPSDVDYLMVAGHGFPRRLGGPMHQADRRGLMVLRSDLRRWAEEDGFWTPAPVLDRLIGKGLRLATLDG